MTRKSENLGHYFPSLTACLAAFYLPRFILNGARDLLIIQRVRRKSGRTKREAKNERRQLNLRDMAKYASPDHFSTMKGRVSVGVIREILFLFYFTAGSPRLRGLLSPRCSIMAT